MYIDFVNALRTIGTGLIICSLVGLVAIIKSTFNWRNLK
jgi:hypothetical protein|nr:MAG TPA: hypothetical protein [Caudoviricetes sp.]